MKRGFSKTILDAFKKAKYLLLVPAFFVPSTAEGATASVKFIWSKSTSPGVENYHLRPRLYGEDPSQEVVVGDVDNVTVPGIVFDKKYEIDIYASNKEGVSDPSNIVYFACLSHTGTCGGIDPSVPLPTINYNADSYYKSIGQVNGKAALITYDDQGNIVKSVALSEPANFKLKAVALRQNGNLCWSLYYRDEENNKQMLLKNHLVAGSDYLLHELPEYYEPIAMVMNPKGKTDPNYNTFYVLFHDNEYKQNVVWHMNAEGTTYLNDGYVIGEKVYDDPEGQKPFGFVYINDTTLRVAEVTVQDGESPFLSFLSLDPTTGATKGYKKPADCYVHNGMPFFFTRRSSDGMMAIWAKDDKGTESRIYYDKNFVRQGAVGALTKSLGREGVPSVREEKLMGRRRKVKKATLVVK